MDLIVKEFATVRNILERLHGEVPRKLRVKAKPLHGGLESAGVLRIDAEFQDRLRRRRVSAMVIKRLKGPASREAAVYQRFVAQRAREISPRLLAADNRGRQGSVLYLEWVPQISSWPWRNPSTAHALVRRLARLHSLSNGANSVRLLPRWNYDAELARSSATALQLLARCRRHSEFKTLARYWPTARRVVSQLPRLRRDLLGYSPLAPAVIHGDVHPGNVLVRRRSGRDEPMLIDWGRARLGSPLEDLSSWLQTLGYWEPEARRRHDSLLSAYLSHRGMEARISRELRQLYWLAGASNALSGALEYHLCVLFEQPQVTQGRKLAAYDSARHYLRIIHRAAKLSH